MYVNSIVSPLVKCAIGNLIEDADAKNKPFRVGNRDATGNRICNMYNRGGANTDITQANVKKE